MLTRVQCKFELKNFVVCFSAAKKAPKGLKESVVIGSRRGADVLIRSDQPICTGKISIHHYHVNSLSDRGNFPHFKTTMWHIKKLALTVLEFLQVTLIIMFI